QPGYGVVGLRAMWLLLDRKNPHLRIERHHAVALGIGHVVGEDDPAAWIGPARQLLAERGPAEDVVAQDQRHIVGADEPLTEDESLRQPVGFLLDEIGEATAELSSVAQEPLEMRGVP